MISMTSQKRTEGAVAQPVLPAPGRQTQEDQEFVVILGYSNRSNAGMGVLGPDGGGSEGLTSSHVSGQWEPRFG